MKYSLSYELHIKILHAQPSVGEDLALAGQKSPAMSTSSALALEVAAGLLAVG